MSEQNRRSHDDPDPQLPGRLAEDLRIAFASPLDVPRAMDARIWAAARRHALHQQRRRKVMRRLQASAAAAAVALATWLSWPAGQRVEPGESPVMVATVAPAFDSTRQANILDAFALARHLQAGEPVGPGWDVNRDGRVDDQDVDLIAARAVSLQERVLQ